jgi:hypothetical protein
MSVMIRVRLGRAVSSATRRRVVLFAGRELRAPYSRLARAMR